MQILHPFSGPVQPYLEQIADPDRHRPTHCPQCQAKHPLIAHGFYSRTLIDSAFDGVIRVRRYLCQACRRAVSLLPEFALPYLRSSVAVIALFLVARWLHAKTLAAALPPATPYQRGQFWLRRFRAPVQGLRLSPPGPPAQPSPAAPSVPELVLGAAKEAMNEAGVWAKPGVGELFAGYQGGTRDSAADAEWLKQVENLCKGALQQFQFQSKLLTSALTPNAALLKFQGSANLTVEQVLRRRSEFLTTHKLNVISVRAEPGIVAITIARPNRRVLHLPEVWSGWRPDCSVGNDSLLIALKEEDSSPLFLSPRSNAPHTLNAGSTGSGKSVLMQNIILAIASTNTPAQAKITVIDPKLGVDYFAFEGLPHLQGGIIDDQEQAIQRRVLPASMRSSAEFRNYFS